MSTLQVIEQDIYNALLAEPEINEETGELIELSDEETNKLLDELANQEVEKIDNIAYAFNHADAEIAFLKEQERRIADRRRAIQNNNERFREYIKNVFIFNKIEKIKGKVHTLSLRKSKRVIIDCEPEELSATYVNEITTWQPDKKLIKEHLKDGVAVEGAHIEENTTLNIR